MFTDLKPYPAVAETGVDWLQRCPRHWRLSPGMALLVPVKTRNTKLTEDTVLSLSFGRIVVKPQDKLHGLVPASFATYQVLDPGAVVIRPTDLQNDQRSARVGLVRNRGIITSAYLAFDVKRGLASEYAFGYLSALDSLKVYYGMGSGLRQNLDWSDFKRLPMLLPPAEEQGAIVRYLGHANRRIDQAIAAKRKLIRLLEEQKQVIINQAVTRGLDRNVPMKESGVNGLGPTPAHWQITAVGRLVSFVTSGSRGWAQYYSDEGAIFLQSGNIGRDMSLNLSRVQRVSVHPDAEGSRTRVRSGDVLVCITGALTGNVGLVESDLDAPAYVNQHVALIRPRSELVLPRYLATALRSSQGQSQFKTEEYGGTKQGLSLADVKGVKISLPPIEEQLRLLARIEADAANIDATVQRSHREIELLREFRARLTADVVTGQVDVRVIAATLPEVELDEPVSGTDEAAADALNDRVFEDLEDA